MGYSGVAFEGVRYGLRNEEAIVMLSGPRCGELWPKVAPYRNKCTRIDLAVTIDLQSQCTEVATNAYNAVVDSGNVRGSFVTSSRGGRTCYIGSRTSQFFARLYDKGAEEGMEPGWIWRYEVECKKPASEAVVQRLLSTSDPGEWIGSYVAVFFSARGVTPLWEVANTQCAIEIGAHVTSDEKALNWLRTGVKPTVGRLIINGREDEVRNALGLPCDQKTIAFQAEEFKWQ